MLIMSFTLARFLATLRQVMLKLSQRRILHIFQNPLHLNYIIKVVASRDTSFKHGSRSEMIMQCEDLHRKLFLVASLY